MNKNILITGATGNLGTAVLKYFVDNQNQIAAIIPPFENDQEMNVPHGEIYKVDLSEEEKTRKIIEKVQKKMGSIHLSVLIVGGFMMGNLENTIVKDLEKMINLNFITAFNCAREVYKIMKNQDNGGGIVFIGARPGLYLEEAISMTAYGLSKSLIFNLSKIINASETSHKIWSSVVVPSIIDTPQNRQAMPDADFSRWVKSRILAEKIASLDVPSSPDYRKEILEIYDNS
jgi:NAD(P)-dependent dehydrogenase (short-subunit alcohol dehydrogenase family)